MHRASSPSFLQIVMTMKIDNGFLGCKISNYREKGVGNRFLHTNPVRIALSLQLYSLITKVYSISSVNIRPSDMIST